MIDFKSYNRNYVSNVVVKECTKEMATKRIIKGKKVTEFRKMISVSMLLDASPKGGDSIYVHKEVKATQITPTELAYMKDLEELSITHNKPFWFSWAN